MDITSQDVHAWVMSKATQAELDLLKDLIAMKTRREFKVGDPVWFDAKTRGVIHGKISKINAKSVSVMATTGNWKVSIDLLHKD